MIIGKTKKRKQINSNSYPDFSNTEREIHSILRTKDGYIILPVIKNNKTIRYQRLSIKDTGTTKLGRRTFQLNDKKQKELQKFVIDEDYKGEIYKYCTHCEDQCLLHITEFTSNKTSKSVWLKDSDKNKYSLSGNGTQPFCKNCKRKYTNSVGNAKRTQEQMTEDNFSRYKGFLPKNLQDSKFNDIPSVFEKFNNQCFKCEKSLDVDERKEYQFDHTLPSSYFWVMNQNNCTLLCSVCNQAKSDKWPSVFYTEKELEDLSKLTGFALKSLNTENTLNPKVIEYYLNGSFDSHIESWYEKSRKKNNKDKYFESAVRKILRKIEKNCDKDNKKQLFELFSNNKRTKFLMEEK
jgi:hypothetical protein